MGSEAGTSKDAMGLIPRFLDDMFTTLYDQKNESVRDALQQQSPAKSKKPANSLVGFSATASFLEVYGEDIYDLLDSNDNNNRISLKLREKEDGQVFVVD